MTDAAAQQPTAAVRPPVPQPVTTPLTASALFLVATIDEGGESAVHDLLSGLTGLARTVATRRPSGELALIAGIGSDAWDRLFSGPRPAELHPFVPFEGDRHRAIATPGDLLFHLRAASMDLCWELGSFITERLAGAATVVDEVHGFLYFDHRAIIGFVDGTENPSGTAAHAAVYVGDADPRFAGGSYAVVQRYRHDMAAWNALRDEQQERVIGRTKLTNVEFDDAVKPSNSHIALNVLDDDADGNPRQILRQNMPFGSLSTGEVGTYFIGYAATPAVTELMLERMFIGDPPGNYDRLLDFSTAETGSLFFVPTEDFLDDPPPLPGATSDGPPPAPAPEPAEAGGDGSLGIGRL